MANFMGGPGCTRAEAQGTKYRLEVRVNAPTPDNPSRTEWRGVHPSGDHRPYEWSTEAEAEDARRRYYPQSVNVRVAPVV